MPDAPDQVNIPRQQGILKFILSGGTTSLLVRCAGLLLGLLSHVLLSRSLGAEAYGFYGIALGWCMILVVPAKFGLDQTVLRFAPVYLESGQHSLLKGLMRYSMLFLLRSCAAVAAVLVLVASLQPDLIGITGVAEALWLVLLVSSLAFLGVYASYFRALRKIFQSQVYEQVLRSAILILLIAAILLLPGIELRLDSALMLTALSATLAAIMMYVGIRRRFSLPGVTGDEQARDWFGLAWPVFFIAVSQQLMANGNIILLGWFSTGVEAGHYAVAARLAALLSFALAAISSISGPLVAVAHERGDFSELRRIASASARLSLLCAGLMAAVLGLFGDYAVALFGSEFGPAYAPMMILVLGGLVNSFTGIVGHFLTMTNRQIVALYILAATTIFNLALGVALIPEYGALGAAAAATIAMAASNLGMAAYVWWKLGVDATALGLPQRHGASRGQTP